MAAQGGPATTAFIERFCDAHRERDPNGPRVTTIDGVWGYCAGHGASDHVWRVIEPRPRPKLESDMASGLI
jgi:hypothetical protein